MGSLQSIKLFDALSASELQRLEADSEPRVFSAGEQIFREGDEGDGLYVVVSGSVEISALVSQNERRVLGNVQEGDFFGEMAVLDGEPRSASAVARLETRTLFLPRTSVLGAIERTPRMAITMVREFSQRMREFNRRYVQEVLQAERLTVVGRFARSIVHDFKNPLHIIGLAAEMMELAPASPEMRKSASGRIRKQVDRLNNMVSELLEFTKSPDRAAVLAPHDYRNYVSNLLAEMRPELEERGVKLILRNEPPSVPILLDPKRLLHVFSNLLHNAVDAIQGNGSVYLSFSATPNEVVTEVEDSGKGIAPEIAENLFEPFATFGKAKGSGLGLSICKRIIEDHGGWIRARNAPGSGAVFSFSLPAQAA